MKMLPGKSKPQGTPSPNIGIQSVPGMAKQAIRQMGGHSPSFTYAPRPKMEGKKLAMHGGGAA